MKICAGASLILENYRPPACNCIQKETPALVFSFEFCQIFIDIFFTEHFQVQMTASCTLTLFSAKYVVQSICFETDHEIFVLLFKAKNTLTSSSMESSTYHPPIIVKNMFFFICRYKNSCF